jgi:sirohydrochlorin ferrochelatase
MTLPDAITALTRRRAVRIVVVLGWAWLGWHLFARGSGAFR